MGLQSWTQLSDFTFTLSRIFYASQLSFSIQENLHKNLKDHYVFFMTKKTQKTYMPPPKVLKDAW